MKTLIRDILIGLILCSIILGVVMISQKAVVPDIVLSSPTPRPTEEILVLQSFQTGEQFDAIYDALDPDIPYAYVIYFSPNCGACHILLTAMNEVTSVPVLAVTVEGRKSVETMIQDLGIAFEILFGLPRTSLPKGIKGYPYWFFTYYLDGEWIIHEVMEGTPQISADEDITLGELLDTWAMHLATILVGGAEQ